MKKRFSMNGQPEKHDHSHDGHIHLNKPEQEQVRAAEAVVQEQKMRVAEAYLLFYQARAALDNATADLETKQKMLLVVAQNIAKDHGINVEDPSQGQWNLDISQMVLKKIG